MRRIKPLPLMLYTTNDVDSIPPLTGI